MKKLDTFGNMLGEIPYYGVRGSISRIDEHGKHYYVYRYDDRGNIGNCFVIPKKYEKKLFENYIDDVKNYLDTNKEKYLTSFSSQLKTSLNLKKHFVGLSVSVVLAISSILASIFTSGVASYIGIAGFFFSFISSCYEGQILNKCMLENKRHGFIHQYKEYLNQVNEYNIKNKKFDRVDSTKYSNIVRQEENVIDLTKKRVLSQGIKRK